MKTLLKLLSSLALIAALAGCVVAPIGPPRRGYVVAPAPVVVVGGGYRYRW